MGSSTPQRADGGLETMRNQTESIQDSASGVIPRAPWRVAEVHALPGYRLAVKFMDDVTGEVDM